VTFFREEGFGGRRLLWRISETSAPEGEGESDGINGWLLQPQGTPAVAEAFLAGIAERVHENIWMRP